MNDAVKEIRIRAEILQHRIQTPSIRRGDCLQILAREMGFLNWPHAKRVLSGEVDEDFGALLCPRKSGGHLNLWYKTHAEAEAVRKDRGGYLLAYRRQFLIVERSYIEALGLDPEDSAWRDLEFDWTRSGQNASRAHIYSQLVAALPRNSE